MRCRWCCPTTRGRLRQRRRSRDVDAVRRIRLADRTRLDGRLVDGRYQGWVSVVNRSGASGPAKTRELKSTPTARSRSTSARRRSGRAGNGFAQIAAEALECPSPNPRHLSRLHHLVGGAMGTYDRARSVMGGSAILNAAKELRARDPRAAVHRLECDEVAPSPKATAVRTRPHPHTGRNRHPRIEGRGHLRNRSGPTVTARMQRMSRWIPKTGRSKCSNTSPSKTSDASSIRTRSTPSMGAIAQGLGAACWNT